MASLSRPASCFGTIETDLGCIDFRLYPDRAPASVRAFRQLISRDEFKDKACFYRVVHRARARSGEPPIDIIQGGLPDPNAAEVPLLHEPTGRTGLCHLDGTLSWARGPLGSPGGSAFFFCIGDQPALDEGGARDPFADGQGFAAFGIATGGLELLRAIHMARIADPTGSGRLAQPIPVRGITFNSASRGLR